MSQRPLLNKILLSHGSGGSLMQGLIKDLFLSRLKNPLLNKLDDSAIIKLKDNRLAFTTDSYVVSPLFFNGADIGKLAICGTINDLVVSGALPRFISLAMIIEEGLDLRVLEKIASSLSISAKKEGVEIVTGDTKVVEKGACDKLFINTCGIGEFLAKEPLAAKRISAGDRIIITGRIAEHGLSILSGRKGFELDLGIKSDCAALGGLLLPVIKNSRAIKFMRDPTRGGLAATLNEIAALSKKGMIIQEREIPISPKAKSACEILGIDPFTLANEGKAVLLVKKESASSILRQLKRHVLGRSARIIGEVLSGPKEKVLLKTVAGGLRVIDMPRGDSLPRIC